MPETRRRASAGYGWFLYPSFVVLAGFFAAMFIWNVGISLLKWPGYGPAKFNGLDNYRRVFENSDFWTSWAHAFYYVIPFALAPALLGLLLAGLVFGAFQGRWGRVLAPLARTGLFLPQIVPMSISALIWLWLLSTMPSTVDWLDQPPSALMATSLLMLWMQTGLAFVIYLAGMSRVDSSQLEAAQLDGANWWQRLRWIIAPVLGPETVVILVFLIIGALKVFAPVYYFTGGGPFDSTQSPAVFAVINFFGGKSVGYATAITTMLALVIGVTLLVVTGILRLIRGKREVES